MTETTDPDGPEQAFDPAQIARDWITVWQSELAALATDREAQEAWQGLVACGRTRREHCWSGQGAK